MIRTNTQFNLTMRITMIRRTCMTIVTLFLLSAGSAFGGGFSDKLTKATDSWHELVAKFVAPNGGVNYIEIARNKNTLKSFIDTYADENLASLDDNSKKAAYINLYNATMMYNLLRYAEEKKISVDTAAFTALKINDISVSGGNIWNGSYKVKLGGQDVNLDDIEHGLLRRNASGALKNMMVSTLDPRIHAAVNCAALSCPPVRNTAYRPDTVEKMLDENMKNFLSTDEQFKMLNPKTMQANSIVFWYYSDFDDHGKNVLKQKGAGDYLATFVDDKARDQNIKTRHLKENFNDRSKVSLKISSDFKFEYDWKVNDMRNKTSSSH